MKLLFAALLAVLAGCQPQPPASPAAGAAASTSTPSADAQNGRATADGEARIAALEKKVDALQERIQELTPEVGVLMGQVRTEHAKLYYAGEAHNWELADYFLEELNEALQAVQTYNDHFEDFPTPLSELVPQLVGPSLGELHQAIRAKDPKRFASAYQSLTAACNACHAALKRPFIHVQPPAHQEFFNQRFDSGAMPSS